MNLGWSHARVKLNLVNGRDNRGVGEKALEELYGEIGDAWGIGE